MHEHHIKLALQLLSDNLSHRDSAPWNCKNNGIQIPVFEKFMNKFSSRFISAAKNSHFRILMCCIFKLCKANAVPKYFVVSSALLFPVQRQFGPESPLARNERLTSTSSGRSVVVPNQMDIQRRDILRTRMNFRGY